MGQGEGPLAIAGGAWFGFLDEIREDAGYELRMALFGENGRGFKVEEIVVSRSLAELGLGRDWIGTIGEGFVELFHAG